MLRNRYLLLAFRFGLGGLFIWAGLLKIREPMDFAQHIANYRVFPYDFAFFLALILPWLEVICGLCLVAGILREASALILSLLLAAFLVLITATIIRGIDIDCGCFGSLSRKVDFKLILTDLFFYCSCL